jgi:hypothetical protein
VGNAYGHLTLKRFPISITHGLGCEYRGFGFDYRLQDEEFT